MKLPEDKTKRMQVLGLSVGVVVGVIWGLVAGVIGPLKRNAGERLERIEQLHRDLRIAEAEIHQMAEDRDTNSNLIERAKSEDVYILHSRLGNFLLSATEAIDAYARAASVDIDTITEVGTSILPERQGQQSAGALNVYSVNVKLRAGLHDVLRLLETANRENPYVAVSSLEIFARAGSPARHDMTLILQWPIWNDSDRAPDLARFLSVPPAVPADDVLTPPPDLLTEPPPIADAPPDSTGTSADQPPPFPPDMEGGPR